MSRPSGPLPGGLSSSSGPPPGGPSPSSGLPPPLPGLNSCPPPPLAVPAVSQQQTKKRRKRGKGKKTQASLTSAGGCAHARPNAEGTDAVPQVVATIPRCPPETTAHSRVNVRSTEPHYVRHVRQATGIYNTLPRNDIPVERETAASTLTSAKRRRLRAVGTEREAKRKKRSYKRERCYTIIPATTNGEKAQIYKALCEKRGVPLGEEIKPMEIQRDGKRQCYRWLTPLGETLIYLRRGFLTEEQLQVLETATEALIAAEKPAKSRNYRSVTGASSFHAGYWRVYASEITESQDFRSEAVQSWIQANEEAGIFQACGQLCREIFPGIASIYEGVEEIPTDNPFKPWHVATINIHANSARHLDSRDPRFGITGLIVFGDFEAGSLYFEKLLLELHLQRGDFIMFNGAILHHENRGVIGDRRSVVLSAKQASFHPPITKNGEIVLPGF